MKFGQLMEYNMRNNSRSKGNQTMKFGQLMEYNMNNKNQNHITKII